MEDGVHADARERCDQAVALVLVPEQQIVEVAAVLAAGRTCGRRTRPAASSRRERVVVLRPDRRRSAVVASASSTCAHRNAAVISLSRYDEPSSSQVYLVDLAAEERGAVRALLLTISARATSAGSLTTQRAALPALDVLRLVEAERRQVADRAERPAVVRRGQRVRRVLDHRQAVRARRAASARPCRTPTPP